MNNFWALTKINFNQTFSSSMGTDSNSKKKKIGMAILLCFLVVYVITFCVIFAYNLAKGLAPVGLINIVMLFGFILSSMLCLMEGYFVAFNLFFKSKNEEMIISMPIKKSTILLSKLATLLSVCYAFSSPIFISFLVIYFVYASFNFWALLIALFCFLLLPLVPIFLGTLISMLVNMATSRLRFKNIVDIILILAITIGIMLVSQDFNGIIANLISGGGTTIQSVGSFYFPALLATKAVTTLSLLNFLYYILISIVPFGILFALICIYYTNLKSFYDKSYKAKVVDYQAKKSSITYSLYKKEIGRIFSSPNYFINGCIGPIMLIIMGAVSCINPNFLGPEAGNNGFVTTLFVIPMLLCMMNPMSATFSLEGNKFWLLKNMPLPFRKIIISKILAVATLFLIPSAISVVMFSLAFRFDVWQILIVIGLAIISTLASSLLGIIINLKNCKLDWKNEITVIKQSASALYMMLFGFSISFVPFILFVTLLIEKISVYYYALIAVGILIITCVVCLIMLIKNGQKLFNKIKV